MIIAQRHVAGEGLVQPKPARRKRPLKVRTLPFPLLHSMATLKVPDAFVDPARAERLVAFPLKVRMCLGLVLQFIQVKDPRAPIWPERAAMLAVYQLTDEVRTLSRHLKAVEDAGLIVRLEQSRVAHQGKYRFREIRLTELAIELLDLDHPVMKSRAGHGPAEKTAKPTQHSSRESAVRGVPMSLVPWVETFGRPGLFYLMALCKSRGCQLQDVLATLKGYLTSLEPKHAKAYVAKSILTNETDWAARANQAERTAAEANASEELRRMEQTLAAKPPGTELHLVSGAPFCVLRDGVGWTDGGACPLTQVARRVLDGSLVLASATRALPSRGTACPPAILEPTSSTKALILPENKPLDRGPFGKPVERLPPGAAQSATDRDLARLRIREIKSMVRNGGPAPSATPAPRSSSPPVERPARRQRPGEQMPALAEEGGQSDSDT